MAFFKQNEEYPKEAKYTYEEFPTYFTWQKGKGVVSHWTNDVRINNANILFHFDMFILRPYFR